MRGLVFLCLVVAVFAKHEHYAGWKSYYVAPSTAAQLKTLGSMIPQFDLDFLSKAILNREGVVLVKPHHQAGFLKALEAEGISYRVHAEDVKAQLDIDDQLIEAQRRDAVSRNAARIPYDNYQIIDVIDDYLDEIAAKYPDVVTLVTPANSFRGHPIKYLKISSSNFEDDSKPVIFIDGGLHAREWISPPTVTYAIHKLVEDLTEPDLLENYDWILLPVVNPDGYNYTFSNERFWRKTRSTDQHSLSGRCPGVDGNRNYDFYWNTVGTSSSPCTDTYAGSRPFSEVETRVVRDIILEYLGRITLYITMHSYGSMILYPWGHDGSLSGQAFALHTVGINMADAINAKAINYFPRYVVGNAVLVLGYGASGASEDYAHQEGVPLTYTFELPGLGRDLQGFHINARYIRQIVEETWEAIVVGARRSAELYGKRDL